MADVSRLQLRDCPRTIEAGDALFAPRMKRQLLRAFVVTKRCKTMAEATRRLYKTRLERDMDAIMALLVEHKDAKRLRKRYGKHRGLLYYPKVAPDNNSLCVRRTHRHLSQSHRWIPLRRGHRCPPSPKRRQCYLIHSRYIMDLRTSG